MPTQFSLFSISLFLVLIASSQQQANCDSSQPLPSFPTQGAVSQDTDPFRGIYFHRGSGREQPSSCAFQ